MLPSGRLFMKSSRSVTAPVSRSYWLREMQPARRSSNWMPAVWWCGVGRRSAGSQCGSSHGYWPRATRAGARRQLTRARAARWWQHSAPHSLASQAERRRQTVDQLAMLPVAQ